MSGWRFHSSRWRSASRESTSARGARQNVKDENSERRSCRGGETKGETGQRTPNAAGVAVMTCMPV